MLIAVSLKEKKEVNMRPLCEQVCVYSSSSLFSMDLHIALQDKISDMKTSVDGTVGPDEVSTFLIAYWEPAQIPQTMRDTQTPAAVEVNADGS